MFARYKEAAGVVLESSILVAKQARILLQTVLSRLLDDAKQALGKEKTLMIFLSRNLYELQYQPARLATIFNPCLSDSDSVTLFCPLRAPGTTYMEHRHTCRQKKKPMA